MSEPNLNKTPLGLSENIEGLLCYALGWVTGIIFLIIEKESKFVKFHAIQSIITFLFLQVAYWVIRFIPFIGGLLATLISILMFILWILLMYKAYNREMYKLPVAGDVAEQQVNN